jgi:hypothetical protein
MRKSLPGLLWARMIEEHVVPDPVIRDMAV